MCDKCANIDYPIADPIWLPCGGPASRYRSLRQQPARDNPQESTEQLSRLVRRIHELRAENSELKDKLAQQASPSSDFNHVA